MIDKGHHPMMMYLPPVVHGGMLIEPTESETRTQPDSALVTAAASSRGSRLAATSC